jgi:HPt (histidine-containing phosphotransfer) domain-containing protein
MYLNNLKLFRERIREDNDKMTMFLNNGDIKNFSITVHAIKSALASIGAEQLSFIALSLETASQNFDAAHCKQSFPSISQRLMALHDALSQAFFPSVGTAENKKDFGSEAEAAAFFKENVQAALDAVNDFDTDAGIAALEKVLSCDYDEQVKTPLESAVRALKHYQYNEAKDILTNILSPNT